MGWKFWESEKSDAERSLEALQAGAPSAVTATPPAPDGAAPPAVPPPSGFQMAIEDVFTITGRGTVVTGQVAAGTVSTGQQVTITRLTGGQPRTTTITGIEAFRKILDTATVGDNIGLLLAGVQREDVERGDVITG